MKITKSKLQQLIREEIAGTINERPSYRYKEQFDMMDGLVNIKAKKAFKKSAEMLQKQLYDEGFDYDIINKFLHAVLNDDV